MNIIMKAYCRTFQAAFCVALPLLPYRDPKIIEHIEDIPDALFSENNHKPLIVTDRTIRGLGLTEPLERSLRYAGMEYLIYDGVVANPTTVNVAEALDVYRRGGCDCIIAFGGGSPMDCAKGVGAMLARPKKTLGQLRGILRVRRRTPTVIAIPTTAGTGSETTVACVIVDSESRHKYAINDFPLIPRYAVLDPAVTATLPSFVAATTGMDALTHAVESYIGRSGNAGTRRDAIEAMKLIFENLESAVSTGDEAARRNMLYAAHLAGRSFSKAYVGYVHALAHALGGRYDTPHGLANAVILPHVLREYGSAIHKKLRGIAIECGLADASVSPEAAAELVIGKIEEMNERFGIPRTIGTIRAEDIAGMAEHAYHEANPLYPVPVLWDRAKLSEMYREVGGLS